MAKLSDRIGQISQITPTGITLPFAGETASVPTGWLLCDGSAVSRTTYPNLHAVLKDVGGANNYGWGNGDGSTTFNLPDMRGASPAGAGTSTKFTQNETLTLGGYEDDQFQSFQTRNYENSFVEARSTGTDPGHYVPATSAGNVVNAQTYTSGVIVSDGNGTPRKGNVTKGKQVVMNYIIKT